MEVSGHIEMLDENGRLLLEAAGRVDLGAPVPTCPTWDLRDLLAHIGYVHRWATAYVAGALTEMVDELDDEAILGAGPPDDEIVGWFGDGHAALVKALTEAPADLDCWTFLEAPSPLAFWARRQAHETCIHRVDAELAAGVGVAPIEREWAADGIDELLLGFFGHEPAEAPPAGDVLSVIGIEPVDDSRRWAVKILADRFRTSKGFDRCDTVVRGPASDLYLLLWNRRLGLDGLEVEGSPELLDTWRDRSQLVWA
ncbi:MAG: maleylpyruvate isomerase family mycothiol-dependent enzyme [Acidimicrobiales bacterium]